MNRYFNFQDFIISTKIALFVMTLFLSVFILLAGTRAALAASLKDVAVVKGDVFTAGDVFHGLRTNADYVLGPAPQPGKDITLNARTLYRIASALDIDWRPQSTSEQVVIRRSATIIPASIIEDKLVQELKSSGAGDDFRLALGGPMDSMVLPDGEGATFEIDTLRYDPENNLFTATIVAPSRDKPLKTMDVSGEVDHIVSLPVLKTTMQNGEIISLSDLDYIEVSAKTLSRETILDTDQIIGQTPRRLALPGKPIGFNDLTPPQMVGRGETVTLYFRDGQMVLATKGKALQNGTMGEMIRVTNVTSNKNLTGIVTGSREITVQ